MIAFNSVVPNHDSLSNNCLSLNVSVPLSHHSCIVNVYIIFVLAMYHVL